MNYKIIGEKGIWEYLNIEYCEYLNIDPHSPTDGFVQAMK